MDTRQQKELLKETLDTVAVGYDSSALTSATCAPM